MKWCHSNSRIRVRIRNIGDEFVLPIEPSALRHSPDGKKPHHPRRTINSVASLRPSSPTSITSSPQTHSTDSVLQTGRAIWERGGECNGVEKPDLLKKARGGVAGPTSSPALDAELRRHHQTTASRPVVNPHFASRSRIQNPISHAGWPLEEACPRIVRELRRKICDRMETLDARRIGSRFHNKSQHKWESSVERISRSPSLPSHRRPSAPKVVGSSPTGSI